MKAAEPIRLDVPAYKQSRNNTCAAVCIKMMIDYLNKLVLTEQTGVMDEESIYRVIHASQGGTPLMNTSLLNSVPEIITASPSLEFSPEYQVHELRDIEKELEQKLPVAVWILVVGEEDDYLHSVVVTGIDRRNKKVCYNDPTFGTKEEVDESRFMSIWEPPGNRMLKVKIGRVIRKTMAEFMPQEEKVSN